MTPQQKQVYDFLVAAGGWVKGSQIEAATGAKGPREVVKQLRHLGCNISSHRAGRNSLGYFIHSGPERN
jgi:hypothetical protein